MLMVVKNNYHYAERDKESPMSFVANGFLSAIEQFQYILYMTIKIFLFRAQRSIQVGITMLPYFSEAFKSSDFYATLPAAAAARPPCSSAPATSAWCWTRRRRKEVYSWVRKSIPTAHAWA